jgi:hypothetical protein
MKEKQVSPSIVVVVVVVVVAIAGFFLWRNSAPPTPTVDPNNPMPGAGQLIRPGTPGGGGMGPSPNAPIPGRQR